MARILDVPWVGRLVDTPMRKRVTQATLWTIGGYSGRQILRFASNLILTRLLMPEAFGLMILVGTTLQGLEMVSDAGIQQNIIQNRRGDCTSFLNTAWMMRGVRGLILWSLACLFARPLSEMFDAPHLALLLPVSGFGIAISGFRSITLDTEQRHLQMRWVALLEVGAQLCTFVVMIVWALIAPSVWALVAGMLAGNLFMLLASHLYLSGPKPRLSWDREAGRDLIRFGKWLFLSSTLTFLVNGGDRFILGSFVTLNELGIIAIAMLLSESVTNLLAQLSQSVLFPVYARSAELGTEMLRHRMFRIRVVLLSAMLPLYCGLTVFGPSIVAMFYDDRYHEAGWMLQLLAAGGIGTTIRLTALPTLMAMGDSFRHLLVIAFRALALVVCLIVGGTLFGLPGLIGGLATAEILTYFAVVQTMRAYHLWMPQLDMFAFTGSGLIIATGLLVFG